MVALRKQAPSPSLGAGSRIGGKAVGGFSPIPRRAPELMRRTSVPTANGSGSTMLGPAKSSAAEVSPRPRIAPARATGVRPWS